MSDHVTGTQAKLGACDGTRHVISSRRYLLFLRKRADVETSVEYAHLEISRAAVFGGRPVASSVAIIHCRSNAASRDRLQSPKAKLRLLSLRGVVIRVLMFAERPERSSLLTR